MQTNAEGFNMGIERRFSDDGKVLSFDLGGRFGIDDFQSFRDSYGQGVEDAEEVIVDLANIEYLDSASLGMLLHMQQQLQKQVKKFRIINTTPEVVKLFRVSRFDKIFIIN